MEYWRETYLSSANPEIIVRSTESIWPSALGAFLGAFFAFVFGLIAFYLQKKFERYWKYRNAIIKLEYLLNDHLNINAGNQYLLKGAIETLKRNKMTYTLLSQFKLAEDINLRIGDPEVLQEYVDYKGRAEKINHGMNTWQSLNEKLHQTIITNPGIAPVIVNANIDQIQQQAESLCNFLISLDNKTKHFLAYIRIYLKKDKYFWSIWLEKKRRRNNKIIYDNDIEKELLELKNEIDDITRKSREEIMQIIKS